MPWRNGLGTTIELLKQDLPDASGFGWRLSMADVTTDGDFSDFSGYDRTLLLLEGNGITLNDGDDKHRLDKLLDVARFRGEDKIFAQLHDGPIRDFNIMVYRQHCTAKVQTCDQTDRFPLEIDADLLLVYAVNGEVLCTSGLPEEIQIPPQHLFVSEKPDRLSLDLSGGSFIAIQIKYLNQTLFDFGNP